ncbi:hypothetical protein AYI70_g1422 [Smittium culicis]|uniref:Uncharacterized protein n=1 Tax=Smittium culicis TaxID=133412 RepID=A0A1R1YDC3_9FUNG|nr:hypothetical protein AYI70_g2739 [Smittium culicis]OMJ24686.1 hypothetical protein AYI70_g1422 [Smittium culicis]
MILVEDKIRAMEIRLQTDIEELKFKAKNDIQELPPIVRDMKLRDFIQKYGGDVSKAVLLSPELTYNFKIPEEPGKRSKLRV